MQIEIDEYGEGKEEVICDCGFDLSTINICDYCKIKTYDDCDIDCECCYMTDHFEPLTAKQIEGILNN